LDELHRGRKMTVSAEVTVYLLRQERLSPAIEAVCSALANQDLEPQIGPMSTFVIGDLTHIFAALRDGFERAAARGHVAMVITVSNACPVGGL
jgi:uncharacterized protein YqgV (UPF0045/DUF77 family)